MKRSTLWTWIGAAVIGVGLAGTARADEWSRDPEHGSSRMQELRSQVAARDQIARPSMEKSVSGREIGRDTLHEGDYKRDFKDRNDMAQHMDEHTKQRATRTPAARGDDNEVASNRQFPNAGHKTSRPTEVLARQARGSHVDRVTEPMTEHEAQIAGTSVTGRRLNQDTIHMGDAFRNANSREALMGQMNTQTSMRASKTEAAAGGEDASGARAYPNAGSRISDPSKLTDKQRKGLAALGFAGAGKKQSQADVEDKSM
jgi:hypothetical protein